MPMDETLAAAAVDFSGRAFCVVKGKFSAKRVGDFQTELIEDFFQGFAFSSRANVHLRVCMADHRTIKLKRYLKRSREPCDLPFRATRDCAMCCRAQRNCFESHGDRLRSGECNFS